MMRVDPDDYYQTAFYATPPLPTNFSEYVLFLQSDRGFLHWAYHAMYSATGNNFDPLVRFFCCLFAASSMYMYYMLTRFTSKPAALAGSLLYLCLASKYWAITIYNAELYIPIVVCAMVFLHVMTSRLPRIAQCAIITPIYWLTLHFYEILIVLVPVFFCAWLGPSFRRRKLPSLSDLVCALVPALVTLFHVSLLATSKLPLWERQSHTSLTRLPHHLWKVFILSLDKNFGAVHWHRISIFPVNFFRFDLPAHHLLWIPLIAVFVSSTVALWIVWSKHCETKTDDEVKNQNEKTLNLAVFAAGMYVALFASLVFAGEYNGEIPSRLLLLPGLGFGLSVATGLQLLRKHWSFRPLFTVALAWCMIEALTFANIVQQLISAYQVDREITEKIVALKSFNLNERQKVFISLPFNDRTGTDWLETAPSYYSQYPFLLWSNYHLPLSKDQYQFSIRKVGTVPATGLYLWLTHTLKHCKPSDLCPFYLDDQGKLWPITKVNVVTGNNVPPAEYMTAFSNMIEPNSGREITLIPEFTPPRGIVEF